MGFEPPKEPPRLTRGEAGKVERGLRLLRGEAGEGVAEAAGAKTVSRVYEPTGSWRERVKVSTSRMEELVWSELVRHGLYPDIHYEIPVKVTIPDLFFRDVEPPLAVYLDGPVHAGRQRDEDLELRELLRSRGIRVLEIRYEQPSRQAVQEAVNRILEELGLRGRSLIDLLLAEAKRDMFDGWGRIIISDFMNEHRCTAEELDRVLKELRGMGYELQAVGGVVRINLSAPASGPSRGRGGETEGVRFHE